MTELTETGRVVAVEADSVWVETVRRTTCGSCTARKGCGHGLLGSVGGRNRNYIRVLPGRASPVDCRVDDQVRIAIPGDVILRGSILVYVLPLLCLLAGAAIGDQLWVQPGREWPAMAGAVAGLVLGLAVLRWHSRRHRDDARLQPTLLEVLHPGGEGMHLR